MIGSPGSEAGHLFLTDVWQSAPGVAAFPAVSQKSDWLLAKIVLPFALSPLTNHQSRAPGVARATGGTGPTGVTGATGVIHGQSPKNV